MTTQDAETRFREWLQESYEFSVAELASCEVDIKGFLGFVESEKKLAAEGIAADLARIVATSNDHAELTERMSELARELSQDTNNQSNG